MALRQVKTIVKRIIADYYNFLLTTGFYRHKKLPQYDFSILTAKWPCKDPMCVSDGFHKGNKEGIDLSICIPMYNCQKFIEQLLTQIDMQKTSFSYEVLLVDDGSKDETAKIVKQFIADKPQFQYIYQQNAGISGARNTGINHASGKYIAFIDDDDEISENYIDALLKKAFATKADMVNGNYCVKKGQVVYPKKVSSGYVWGGVYLASLFDKVRFPVGYWYEDMINNFIIRPLAKSIQTVDEVVIYHNDVQTSESKKWSNTRNYRTLEQLYLAKALVECYKKLGLTDKNYLAARLMTECSTLMVLRTNGLEEEIKMQIFLACNKLFMDNDISIEQFTGTDRRVAKAILDKDYEAWRLAAYMRYYKPDK